MPKVTMQDIADATGVSRISVWKVFNNSYAVSDALRKKVLDKATELGYEKVKEMNSETMKDRINIAVVVSRPESSTFWGSIIHSIAGTLSEHDVNLIYTYVPPYIEDGYELPEVLKLGMVSGMIIMNVYDEKLLLRLNASPVEKIFLDIPSSVDPLDLNGDLLLIEGRNSVRAITDHLIDDRHQKVLGFVGDTRYALTNKLRYEGFVESLRNHGLVFEDRFLMNDPIGITEYRERITGYLDGLESYPDAFVCVSDFVASYVEEWCLRHHDKLDKPILISGFDGSEEYPLVAGKISTAFVDTHMIGRLLAMKILTRVSMPALPKEVSDIYPELSLV